MLHRLSRLSFSARCWLSLLSAVVYSMAYPPLGWRWLVLPGLAGLLVALHGQRGTRARTIGFIHGMAAYAVGLSWLYEIFGVMVVALWCVLAAFTALFAEMQGRVYVRGVIGWKLAAFTALNWCGWEFIRAELFPLKFPWMTAGLAIGPNALLPWIGVYGVGVIVIAAAWHLAVAKWKHAVALMVLLAALAWLPPASPVTKENESAAVKIGGIQLENVSLTEFLKATEQLPADVKYVVWPEYAVPYDLRLNKRDWALVQALCHDRDITLTLGTQARPVGADHWRNIALTMDSTGVRGEHTKVHTVHFFDDGIPGTSALPVQTGHGKIGTPVCFDCDYEGVVRRMTAAGAEMFVVPIMDAEPWSARQHDQHAELFRIRACENGRWMFVCGTSGVSQVIDAQGKVHGRLAALETGTLVGLLKRERELTFYTRFGWLAPWCALGMAAICWIWLIRSPRPISTEAPSIPVS